MGISLAFSPKSPMHIISWQRSRQLGNSVLGVTSAKHDPSMTTGNQGKHPTSLSLSLLYPLHPLHSFSQPPIHININILFFPTTTLPPPKRTNSDYERRNRPTRQRRRWTGRLPRQGYILTAPSLDSLPYSLSLSPPPTLNPSHLPTSSLTPLLNLPCLHTYLPSLPRSEPFFPLPLLDLDLNRDLHLGLQS